MQTRPFSPEMIFTSIPALLPYLAVTLVVGVTSILTGSLLGMLLAWAKLSGHRVIRMAADGGEPERGVALQRAPCAARQRFGVVLCAVGCQRPLLYAE